MSIKASGTYSDSKENYGLNRVRDARVLGEVIAGAFIGGIAWMAQATGVPYILFPEIGALAYDIFVRPNGTWAKALLMLIATPVITAVYGTFIAQHFDYGLVSVLLIVGGAVLILRILKSPIAPAISAGLLPLSLGVTSWWYPPSILIGIALLAGIAVLRARFLPMPSIQIQESDRIDDQIEQPPSTYSWLPFFIIFLVIDSFLADAVGWRFLLYPPLVVIGFEMFAHSDVCPWAERPWTLPVACMATAAAGVMIVTLVGPGPMPTMFSMAIGVMILRLARLHVPPALAVGILPFVIDHPDSQFPIAVGVGTALLTLTFVSWTWFSNKWRSIVPVD